MTEGRETAWREIAEAHGLLKVGGSDYHGLGGPHERMLGDIPLPDEDIEAFLERAGQANLSRGSQN